MGADKTDCKPISNLAIAVLAIVFFPGCFSADQHSTQSVSPGSVAVAVPLPRDSSPREADPGVDKLRAEASASSNATQQSLTGLGLQVAKLGEHVEGLHSEISAVANVANTIKSEVDINAKIDVIANTVLDFKASINNRMEALAAAQVGMNNSIQKTTETIKAGGNVTQFPSEVKDVMLAQTRTIENSNNDTSWDIKILGGVIIALHGGAAAHTALQHRKLRQQISETQNVKSNDVKSA